MGLGGFLGQIGSGIAKFGGKVWNGIKNTAASVGKIAKPVINVASKVTPFLSALPGHVGAVSAMVAPAVNAVNSWINKLPDSKVKSKMKEYSDKGSDFLDKTEKVASNMAQAVADGANATKPIIDKLASVL